MIVFTFSSRLMQSTSNQSFNCLNQMIIVDMLEAYGYV